MMTGNGLRACGCGQPTKLSPWNDQTLGYVKGGPRQFLLGHNFRRGSPKAHRYGKREAHAYWRGGSYVSKRGYRMIRMPDHPHAESDGYVREHILIVERILGKRLPVGALVHHVSGEKADNRPTNFVVCPDRSYHALLHQRQRAWHATGNPRAQRCVYCHQWLIPGTPGVTITGRKSRAYHQRYARDHARQKRALQPKVGQAGEHNSHAKLSAADVRAIRAAYDPRLRNSAVLANAFQVTRTNILDIVHRKTWASVVDDVGTQRVEQPDLFDG
jgi:hypothetical protein